jgi:D-alanyl-lipoteichoic acid acyltransferase DltB (MBOAT superfamily)
MLFNSLEYLFLFLPVTVLVFLMLSRAPTTERQIYWLVLASLVFYASWKPVYLLLIVASVVVNFALGKRLAREAPQRTRAWLVAGVCFNLGLLGYFKYTGFFLEGLNSLGVWLIPIPEITLPLAISFFTFQQIAYLVDVSRRDCREYQFHHYALFVLFFPQLIAGPIVHHKEMMPQFDRLRADALLATDFAVGTTFIAVGLFKKVVMADSLALIADPVFETAASGGQLNAVDALLGTYAFSFQIYFDFSGYSDIAIGSARLFGIRLPENFRSPYKSRSIIEIWQRWHMTLSRFLRDYLYFTLGGNRHGSLKRYRNLMITMLLGGLWHGAAWTFVIWGGLHGLYLCINHAWRSGVSRAGLQALFSGPLFQPLFVLITFTAWSVALVIFRAEDMPTAWSIINAGFFDLSLQAPPLLGEALSDSLVRQLLLDSGWQPPAYTEIWLLVAVAAGICWALPNTQELLFDHDPVAIADNAPLAPHRLRWRPSPGFALFTALLLSVSVLSLSSISRFIYFQF